MSFIKNMKGISQYYTSPGIKMLNNCKNLDLDVGHRRCYYTSSGIWKELEELADRYNRDDFDFGEGKTRLQQAFKLQHDFESAMEKENKSWKDPIYGRIYKKVQKIVRFEEYMEGYVRTGKPYLCVKGYLIQRFETLSLEQAKEIHARAMKVGVLDRGWEGWGVSIIGLYGDHTSYSLKYAENVFYHSKEKTRELYNQLLYVYSRSAPEKAEALFKQMVERNFVPDSETFRALIAAFSQGFMPDKACEYFRIMLERYNISPTMIHFGALVDSFARTGTEENILLAVEIVKSVTLARTEASINSILSRCVAPASPSVEDLAKLKKIIPIVQKFVNELDDMNFSYAVLVKTHWRLARFGLEWPESVKKK